MSTVRYTPIRLQTLSEDELQRIIIEEGLRPLPQGTEKTRLVQYILDLQMGKGRNFLPTPFSAGMVTGPIDNTVALIQDYYDAKANVTNQLAQLNDAALFAVVDKLGHNLQLADPYVIVNGLKMNERAALIWFLIGLRSA